MHIPFYGVDLIYAWYQSYKNKDGMRIVTSANLLTCEPLHELHLGLGVLEIDLGDYGLH